MTTPFDLRDKATGVMASAFAVFVISLAFVIDLGYLTFKDRVLTKEWNTVEATPIDFQCGRGSGSTPKPNSHCRFLLRYSINDKTHQVIETLSTNLATQYREQRQTQREINLKIPLKVNPSNPDDAFLSDSGRKTWDIMIITELIPITASIFLIAYLLWRQTKPKT